MKPNERKYFDADVKTQKQSSAIRPKPFTLERKVKLEELAKGALFDIYKDWSRFNHYASKTRAEQALEHMLKSDYNRLFDWRIVEGKNKLLTQ